MREKGVCLHFVGVQRKAVFLAWAKKLHPTCAIHIFQIVATYFPKNPPLPGSVLKPTPSLIRHSPFLGRLRLRSQKA